MLDVNTILVPELWDLRDRFRAKGFDLRLVGGCVRDLLAGITPKDVDLHTDAEPLDCTLIYKEAGIKFIATGLSHGTITVVFDHVPFEITSLREDVTTDGRHAEVAYTSNWVTDLARRDFTFNAMSMSFEGELLDPFNGKEDLDNGVVRFVGDARKRIQEDYLRILRWFRFRGRFEKAGSNPDLPTENAIRNFSHGLTKISKERIWSEISKILVGPRAGDMMQSMDLLGVSLKTNAWSGRSQSEHVNQVHAHTKNPVTMLVAYCRIKALTLLKEWKASRHDMDLASWLIKARDAGLNPFHCMAVDNMTREWAVELAILQGWDTFELELLKAWPVPVFPVTGMDLIKRGMVPGPWYGQTLTKLKTAWADSDFAMTKDQLLNMLDE